VSIAATVVAVAVAVDDGDVVAVAAVAAAAAVDDSAASDFQDMACSKILWVIRNILDWKKV